MKKTVKPANKSKATPSLKPTPAPKGDITPIRDNCGSKKK